MWLLCSLRGAHLLWSTWLQISGPGMQQEKVQYSQIINCFYFKSLFLCQLVGAHFPREKLFSSVFRSVRPDHKSYQWNTVLSHINPEFYSNLYRRGIWPKRQRGNFLSFPNVESQAKATPRRRESLSLGHPLDTPATPSCPNSLLPHSYPSICFPLITF